MSGLGLTGKCWQMSGPRDPITAATIDIHGETDSRAKGNAPHMQQHSDQSCRVGTKASIQLTAVSSKYRPVRQEVRMSVSHLKDCSPPWWTPVYRHPLPWVYMSAYLHRCFNSAVQPLLGVRKVFQSVALHIYSKDCDYSSLFVTKPVSHDRQNLMRAEQMKETIIINVGRTKCANACMTVQERPTFSYKAGFRLQACGRCGPSESSGVSIFGASAVKSVYDKCSSLLFGKRSCWRGLISPTLITKALAIC